LACLDITKFLWNDTSAKDRILAIGRELVFLSRQAFASTSVWISNIDNLRLAVNNTPPNNHAKGIQVKSKLRASQNILPDIWNSITAHMVKYIAGPTQRKFLRQQIAISAQADLDKLLTTAAYSNSNSGAKEVESQLGAFFEKHLVCHVPAASSTPSSSSRSPARFRTIYK